VPFPTSNPKAKAVLICNPEAGRRKRLRPAEIRKAKEELERAGIEVAIREISAAASGARLALDAVQSGVDLVIVCGGDGTINGVLGGMARSQVPLAILPGGTANVLARELGLPLDIVKAARKIPTSAPRRLALGCADGRFFLAMAGVGFDARVVKAMNGQWKAVLGMGSYILEAIRQLFLGPPNPFFTVSWDGRRQTATFACFSKSQHYGPVRAVREADLFSDRFHAYCFHSQSPWRYLVYAGALLTARQASLSDFSAFPARSIRCEPAGSCREDIFFQVDGELAGKLPCTIEIIPDALTLLVPNA
jgi:YegS/Rv2252/BmrU family lipid kinase